MIRIHEKREKGSRFVWNVQFQEALESLGLGEATDFQTLDEERGLLRDIGIRRNYRLDCGGDAYHLKVHREGSRNGKRSWGFREWSNHLRLLNIGLKVPAPVAWGFGSGFSFFMSKECGTVTAEAFAAEWNFHPFQERREWIRKLGCLVKRLHGAGFFHRDLYLCHVLLERDEPVLIDLQRLTENPIFRRHRRIKDLAALLYSSMELPFSRTDRMRFFREYWDRGKLGTKRMIRAVAAKAQKIKERQRAKGLR